MDKKYEEIINQYKLECVNRASNYSNETKWKSITSEWINFALKYKYMYNFLFMGRPIIQIPVDMIAIQELIWFVKPDLIIETGIAHGGSLVMSASMLALLDYCDAVEAGINFNPKMSIRKVIGIDIEIRPHNRAAIESHPLYHKIKMIEGNSVSQEVISEVFRFVKGYEKILIILDSNHTHDHVLAELEAYAPLVSKGSYCVVFDTVVDDMPAEMFLDRPWGPGNNPKTAVREYRRLLSEGALKASDGELLKFEVDTMIENKLLITFAPEGYLRRV